MSKGDDRRFRNSRKTLIRKAARRIWQSTRIMEGRVDGFERTIWSELLSGWKRMVAFLMRRESLLYWRLFEEVESEAAEASS